MNKTIWKFKLKLEDVQSVTMPIGAEILTIQTQNESPCLWALVGSTTEKETRCIEIFGTGHPVGEDIGVSRRYISTFQMSAGMLVFHAFEKL